MTDPALRLLILDDDPAVGETILLIVEGLGVSARATTSPEEFFRLASEWDPTHIALDLVMPGMDGVQIISELARAGSRARLIITSGVGGRVLDAASRSAAARGLAIAGVLPKPFTAEELRRLVIPSADSATAGTPVAHAPERRGPDPVRMDDLRAAIRNRELKVVYQPKVHCSTGALGGFEALVRWIHPRYGPVPPDQFVPMAERAGLVDELTDQVLEQSLAWFARFFPVSHLSMAVNLPAPPREEATLSMNVSARTVGQTEFLDRVMQVCRRHDLPPSRLIFELTETSAMEDPLVSLDVLTRLRMREFQLSIDDFGTGYSSMTQLARLPFSEVKIDRSFVMAAGTSPESRAVIKATVDLGRSLSLTTVAEGVEDPAVLAWLREVGCDLAQGYLIARPMDGDAALAWMRQWTGFSRS